MNYLEILENYNFTKQRRIGRENLMWLCAFAPDLLFSLLNRGNIFLLVFFQSVKEVRPFIGDHFKRRAMRKTKDSYIMLSRAMTGNRVPFISGLMMNFAFDLKGFNRSIALIHSVWRLFREILNRRPIFSLIRVDPHLGFSP
jgi:hypothetical protein